MLSMSGNEDRIRFGGCVRLGSWYWNRRRRLWDAHETETTVRVQKLNEQVVSNVRACIKILMKD